jgi:hypothetical protein
MSTSFISINYPAQHPGVVRAERSFGALARIARAFDTARATSSLLLAAIVAALLVVANQVVDTWTEGHLLAAWIALWTVAFAALALLAAPARRATSALRSGLKAWNERRMQAAQDEQYWQAALADARVMADISRAMSAAALDDVKRNYCYY